MIKIIVDSMIFDELIVLSLSDLSKILEKCELITTDINQIELNRIPDKKRLEKIENIIKQYFTVIPAKIFSLAHYNESISEDSDAGLAMYDSIEEGGRMLRYQDAEMLNIVVKEEHKTQRGRAFNDQAIVLAMGQYPDALFVTEEKRLITKVKKCGRKAVSFAEFKKLIGISRG